MDVILDFDGTITVKDTIAELAKRTISRLESFYWNSPLQLNWHETVRDYWVALDDYNRRHVPAEAERHDVESELKYLSGIRDIENASIDRVEGMFARMGEESLFDFGVDALADESITLRPGLDELLRLAFENGRRVIVISVNWSDMFIRGVLHEHPDVLVVANRVTASGIQGPRCLRGGRMTTCSDKAACLAAVSKSRVFYFGDSTTDLECLLHPRTGRGRGIVISENEESSMMRTLERVGVRLAHVGDLQDGAALSWARDFDEVLRANVLKFHS